jgi:hypothetical protein
MVVPEVNKGLMEKISWRKNGGCLIIIHDLSVLRPVF